LIVLPVTVRPKDEDEGYRVQDTVHELLADTEWGQVVGHKIGCTTSVMQHYLGIPNPCAGGVFTSGVHASGVTLNSGNYVRVGIECEIAVRLQRDLGLSHTPFTADAMSDAIATYMPAIELVDDRYADWKQMDAPTLIADDFFAAGCVLGDPIERDAAPDLSQVVGQALVNGVEVGRGIGADVMGHPHHALAWLANNFAQRGKTLRAGEIVLMGSLVQTVWLKPGDHVVANLSGLGSVGLNLESP